MTRASPSAPVVLLLRPTTTMIGRTRCQNSASENLSDLSVQLATDVYEPPPITRLPPEVLLQMISMLILDRPPGIIDQVIPRDEEYTGTDVTYTRTLGWIAVTHVCRLWRDLHQYAVVLGSLDRPFT